MTSATLVRAAALTHDQAPSNGLFSLLASSLRTVVGHVEGFCASYRNYVQAIDNGNLDFTPREIANARTRLDQMEKAAKESTCLLCGLAESAESGQLVLPEGSKFVCLRPVSRFNSNNRCGVFALPGDFGPPLFDGTVEGEGINLLFYGTGNPILKRLLKAEVGGKVRLPWDGKMYFVDTVYQG